MSVKVSRANSLYGYPSPQSNQFLDPVVTNRAPLTSDRGIAGQVWVDQTNNLAYMFNKNSAGLAQWIQIVAGGGAGSATITAAGNIIVPLATITANDRVLISRTSTGNAVIGQPVVTIQAGVSFTITCYDADGVTVTITDVGSFDYVIIRQS